MYSKLLALVAITAILSGCGILGKKEEASRTISYNSSADGCLNEFGPNVEKYLDGNIESSTWQKTWDCTIDSIELFSQFVKGSTGNGYNQDDVYNLVTNFLITNQSVSKSLIDASFAFKATLLGGKKDEISREELKKLIELFKIGRDSSLKILPYLRLRKTDPTSSNLLKLSDEIQNFTKDVSIRLENNGNLDFQKGDLETLVNELGKLHHWSVPLNWIVPVLSVKEILLAGSTEAIEGNLWGKIFRLIGSVAGPSVASASANSDLMKGPNEYYDFIFSLALRYRSVLDDAITAHDGLIAFSRFDNLMNSIPEEWLPETLKKYDRKAIQIALRPIFQKILKGGKDVLGMNKRSLDTAFELASNWNRGQTHLETIITNYKLDTAVINPSEFIDAAKDYSKGLDELGQKDVSRLIYLMRYKPLFKGDENEITFNKFYTYSKGDLSKKHWMNLVIHHVLDVYGNKERKIRKEEADVLLGDFLPTMIALKIIDPTIKDLGRKRVNEADMFTYASNGDGAVDEDEATYYLAMMLSSGSMSDRMRKVIEPICKIYPATKDPLDWYWMDSACWRREFFNRYRTFWNKFEVMLTYYDDLISKNPTQVKKLQISIETSARRYGCTSLPIGGLDNMSFAALMHYVETMFLNYDANFDQKLDKDEVLKAYPSFKNILLSTNAALKPDDDMLLSAAFTYTVKYGSIPNIGFNNWGQIVGTAKFLWWIGLRELWYINAPRSAVYDILPVVSAPDTPPPPTNNSPGGNVPIQQCTL